MFSDKPTIADLSLACELTALIGFGYPIKEQFPSIHEWFHEHMLSIKSFKINHEKGAAKVKILTDAFGN